jgi:hypothetical protein
MAGSHTLNLKNIILLQDGGMPGNQLALEGHTASSLRAAEDTWIPPNSRDQKFALQQSFVNTPKIMLFKYQFAH